MDPVLVTGVAAIVLSGILTVANKWRGIRAQLQDTFHRAAGDSKPMPTQAAPEGFAEHVGIILQASEGCPPEARIAYMLDELTEAEVLWAEVKRLRASQGPVS